MISDPTTFFLSFLTVFLALGAYLVHLDRKVDALARQVTASTTEKSKLEVETP